MKRKFIGLMPSHQTPLLERVSPDWLLWINYAPGCEMGTYLRLKQDGSITRETCQADGRLDSIVTVKPVDK